MNFRMIELKIIILFNCQSIKTNKIIKKQVMSITSKLDLTNMFSRLKNLDQKDEGYLNSCFTHKRRPFSVCVPKTKDD
jgi:hypothetical protein